MLNFSDPNLSCHVYRHIQICSQKMLTSSADDVVLNKKRRKQIVGSSDCHEMSGAGGISWFDPEVKAVYLLFSYKTNK